MPSGLAARNGGRVGLALLVAVLLLGLGLRVGYAWDGREPVYDARAYAAIAANLEDGDGFTVGAGATQPSSNYSPGLPLFVAGLYGLTGGVDERLARLVLAVIGAFAVLFAYLIGRRLGGVAAGLAGALAVAVYPAFLEYGGMLMSEPLAATLLSGGVLALFWARDRNDAWPWVIPGLALGALTLVRPEYLGVGILLAIVATLPLHFVAQRATKRGRWPDWGRWLGAAALVLAGMAVVIVPWTVRNAVALDRVVPVSTGGGQVLFAGTYLPSDGDPEKVGAGVVAEHPELFGPDALQRLRLEQILARLAAASYPDLDTDQALSRLGREQLWDELSAEPLAYAGFVATKVGRIWSHGPRQIMREPVWAALHWVLLVLGISGLAILAWCRRWEALVIATVFLAITAISALLVASPRRVLVMAPLLASCAGFAAVWLADQMWKVGLRPSQKRSS
jgi:4-amino-4-deoxy-L-arabinose transferase-like glycosyltransferase